MDLLVKTGAQRHCAKLTTAPTGEPGQVWQETHLHGELSEGQVFWKAAFFIPTTALRGWSCGPTLRTC